MDDSLTALAKNSKENWQKYTRYDAYIGLYQNSRGLLFFILRFT